MRARDWLVLLLPALFMAGALGAPYPKDEVAFEVVERQNFDALAVHDVTGAPSTELLTLHLHFLGDGADADLSPAFAWLRAKANVIVVRDEQGAPFYLTTGDLSATSGRATLGATLPTGMAIEMSNAAVGQCVAAHEILHFLGLGHVEDPTNIMAPHCTRDMLATAHLEFWQKEKIDSLDAIKATTTHGVETWVTRG